MEHRTIMPGSFLEPQQAMVSALYRTYDVLTDEFIQRWLYQLYADHRIDPEYLFVSEQGRRDVRKVFEAMPRAFWFAGTGMTVDDIVSRYANQSTGTQMHVVVLPTLEDKMLMVGNLVIIP